MPNAKYGKDQGNVKKPSAAMYKKSMAKMDKKSPAKKYKSDAQRKAVHASKADGGKGAPSKMNKKSPMKMKGDLDKDGKMSRYETARQTAIEKNMKKSPSKMYSKKSPAKMADKKSMAKMADKKSMAKKSKQRVEQDLSRNAIADFKAGKKKQGKYEKRKALELAAGESGVMMKKSMAYMKTNQMGGGVAAKDSAAPARQLKKLGSILSKHMKSN